MQLRRRRQSIPSVRDFSRSARPSIRGYGIEADATETDGTEGTCGDGPAGKELNRGAYWVSVVLNDAPVCVTASKRERLVNNLQNLSVSDRIGMLRGMPLSVAEKRELR